MLQNILTRIEAVLDKNFNISQDSKKEILNFMKNYKKGMYIYAGIFKRKFNFPPKEIYDFLFALEKENILKSYFKVYCNNCLKENVELYENISQIPNEVICEECENLISSLENIIVVYRVIDDGRN